MKKIFFFFFLFLNACDVLAEPEVPAGYDYLAKIAKPLEKIADKQIYSVVLVKPLPENFDRKPFKMALSFQGLTKGQYFAFKNAGPIYVASEQKVSFVPGSDKEVQMQKILVNIGRTVEEATEGFEQKIMGVGCSESRSMTEALRAEVTEIIGGEAICVEDVR